MLCNKLKELRISLHLTQKEVAEKLNIKRERYTQYEIGKRTPRGEMLVKLAEFYNVSIDYLIKEDEEDICNNISYDLYDVFTCIGNFRIALQNEDVFYQNKRMNTKLVAILNDTLYVQDEIIKAFIDEKFRNSLID